MTNEDPSIFSANVKIPTLAYGLYKVPCGNEGIEIISNAILAGYRHFDGAKIYGNEKTLGKALSECINKSCIENNNENILQRSDFFIASKVWNDNQKNNTVRSSVLSSLQDLQLDYIDIVYVHWPVPEYFVNTYRELIKLQKEGIIKYIGISNFRIIDYEQLLLQIPKNDFVQPLIHQFEISPFMYRPEIVRYYKNKNILLAASKALNRTEGLLLDNKSIVYDIAKIHCVTPIQILLRWNYQKQFIVICKTIQFSRMKENRNLFQFSLSSKEMDQLDNITTDEVIRKRNELEDKRRTS